MGHTEHSRTLFAHYRRAVLEIEAKAYFGDLNAEGRKAWLAKRINNSEQKQAA